VWPLANAPAGLPTIAVALGLGAARALPIVWLVPAFGGHDLPLAARLGLSLLLATLGLPQLLLAADAPALAQLGAPGWLLVVTREVLIGAAVGWVVSLAFRAAEAAGGLVDRVRGAGDGAGAGDNDNLAEALAPPSMSGVRSSPLGTLYFLAAAVIFLELGGLGRLAVALARSYEAIPIGAGARGASALTAGMRSAVELVISASAKLIESAVGLAAPVIVALWLADLVLGAVARLTPALPIHFAALPLRALLGVGVVLLGLGAIEAALAAEFPGWIGLADRGFALWGR
jgi:type III secretory pathway component EscT